MLVNKLLYVFEYEVNHSQLLLNEEKPLKIRITGSITVNDEKVSINTGGFSLM